MINENNSYEKINEEKLKEARNLLKDEESKKVFDKRVKFLSTKDWNTHAIPQSTYEEYHHPNVPMREGDIVIAGGVSEWIEPELLMSKIVKDKGFIIGFEPDPEGLKSAQKQLDNLNITNIKLENLGLWDKEDTLEIVQTGRSSTFCYEVKGAPKVECKLTYLDKYIEENNISKIDFIKFDIECAELKALKGSEKLLKKHSPKLAICVYHLPTDLFEIILYLNSLNLGYEFYMGHHRDNEWSTVLYAIAK